ncbi:MAG TPA: hypothetical protein VIG72_06435 [Pontibacter sp.]
MISTNLSFHAALPGLLVYSCLPEITATGENYSNAPEAISQQPSFAFRVYYPSFPSPTIAAAAKIQTEILVVRASGSRVPRAVMF